MDLSQVRPCALVECLVMVFQFLGLLGLGLSRLMPVNILGRSGPPAASAGDSRPGCGWCLLRSAGLGIRPLRRRNHHAPAHRHDCRGWDNPGDRQAPHAGGRRAESRRLNSPTPENLQSREVGKSGPSGPDFFLHGRLPLVESRAIVRSSAQAGPAGRRIGNRRDLDPSKPVVLNGPVVNRPGAASPARRPAWTGRPWRDLRIKRDP